MKPARVLSLVAALALGACEPYDLSVVPTSGAVEARALGAGVDIPMPPDAPVGELELASYGLVDVGSQAGSAGPLRALHLRMTLVDHGPTPWTVDTRDQRIDVEGYGASVAAFASADAGTRPPLVVVPPGGVRVIDLFFPLPDALQSDENLPSVDAIWSVEVDGRVVSERTPFDAIAVQPVETYDPAFDYGPEYYWGPPYWYNPYYASFGFGVILPPVYLGAPIYVHRHPHFGHFGPHDGHYPRQYPRYPRGEYPHRGYPGAVGPPHRPPPRPPPLQPPPPRQAPPRQPPTRVAPPHLAPPPPRVAPPPRTLPPRYITPPPTVPRVAPPPSSPPRPRPPPGAPRGGPPPGGVPHGGGHGGRR
jgi:hypothetical protein